jgi:cold shock CspA family protein
MYYTVLMYWREMSSAAGADANTFFHVSHVQGRRMGDGVGLLDIQRGDVVQYAVDPNNHARHVKLRTTRRVKAHSQQQQQQSEHEQRSGGQVGHVEWFDLTKRYGFIRPIGEQQEQQEEQEEQEQEKKAKNLVYMHQTALVGLAHVEHPLPLPGTSVQYDVEMDRQGRRMAVHVTAPGGGPVAHIDVSRNQFANTQLEPAALLAAVQAGRTSLTVAEVRRGTVRVCGSVCV